MRRRDPALVEAAESAWRTAHGAEPLQTPLVVGRRTLASRVGILSVSDASFADTEGAIVRISDAAGADEALLIVGPDSEAAVDDAFRQLPRSAADAGLVIVAGGTALSRALLSERIRFDMCVRTAIAMDTVDHDLAYTLVLSGRADAVAYPEETTQ
jgi:anthraniloyl-CoA monooxygenase